MSTEDDRGGGSEPLRAASTPKELLQTLSPEQLTQLETRIKEEYAKLPNPEVNLETYRAQAEQEFFRRFPMRRSTGQVYAPTLEASTPCGNGFEQKQDLDEWQGAYGTRSKDRSSTNYIDFSTLTNGVRSNDSYSSPDARQTWVAAGEDPVVKIRTTAPGSSGAVRIGNAATNYGCELLSKTFIVTPAASTIRFWYAVVFQDPGHGASDQPFFWVRVTDASGSIVPGAFDFGDKSPGLNGARDVLVANSADPLFTETSGTSHGKVVHRDWSSAQIDLSSQVGKQVTLEFVTADCGQGGHWGYAYIDSFTCEGCAAIDEAQEKDLNERCAARVNLLPRAKGSGSSADSGRGCSEIRSDHRPDIQPCISVAWGNGQCDRLETNAVEVLCVTVCNCFSTATFCGLTIGRVRVTDALGRPVPNLPDGTPSVQVIPSGPICFGDLRPSTDKKKPSCVSRELVVYTRGAVRQDYRLSFEGICFRVFHTYQSEQSFILSLCHDPRAESV